MDMKTSPLLIFIGGVAAAAVVAVGYIFFAPPEALPQVLTDKIEAKVATNNSAASTQTAAGSSQTAPSGNPVSDGSGHYIYTVSFNSDTFNPAVLTIRRGDSVKWVNKDNLTMKVSATLANSSSSPVVDPKSEPKGGSFSMSFSTPGIWIVSNINGTGPRNAGGNSVIYVTE
jgi:plastocyanin